MKRLGDLAEVTVGFVGSMTPHYRDSGVTFLRSQNVRRFFVDTEDVLHIDEEFEGAIKKSRLNAGDVVVVRTGAPGTAAVVPPSLEGANCADLVIVRPGANLDSRWLCGYLNSVAAQVITSHLVGAVQQHFNVGVAKSLMLPDVPIWQQRAIGEVLGALDDKIAANRRVVEAADAFRATVWADLARTGSVTPLSGLARFVNGGAYTKDASGTGRPVIRIADLNNGFGGSTVYNDIEVPDDQTARSGDYLMAWSGSLTSRRWFRQEGIVNQHIFKVLPTGDHPLWAVACAVERQLDHFRAIAADKATTMGHIQRRHLDEPVPWPSAEALGSPLALVAATGWDRALAAELETEALAATRDELLPLLMSGRITVKDAEKTVEGVV